MRRPVFELHIVPMIRAMDRAHMSFFGDLWDYDVHVQSADQILAALERSMPTPETGGPWPPEWIRLYRRWTATGFKRLSLGLGDCRIERNKTVVGITATVQLAHEADRAWLQLETDTPLLHQYALYIEAADNPKGGKGGEVDVGDQFEVEVEGGQVFVRDASGLRELIIPPGAPPGP